MILNARTWTEVVMTAEMISILLENNSPYKMYFISSATEPTGVPSEKVTIEEAEKGVYFAYPAPLKLWVYMDAPTGATGILITGVKL